MVFSYNYKRSYRTRLPMASKSRGFRFGALYLFLGTLFYFYQYVLRVSTGVLTDNLMEEFSITASSVGTIMGLSSISYVMMQMPAGTTIDYFGLKRLLPLGFLICALGTFLFASAEDMTTLTISRLLLGGGAAFAFVGATKIISLYFSEKRMAALVSFTILVGTSGGIMGVGPLAHFIQEHGWRPSLKIVALLGALLAIILYLVGLKTYRKEKPKNSSAAPQGTSVLEGVKMALRTPQILLVCAWGFCIYMPLCVFADAWGVPYLQAALGCAKTDAAVHVSYIYIGVLVGCLFYGWIGTKYPNYRLIFSVSTALLLLAYVGVLWHLHLFVDHLDGLFLVIGFLNSVQLLMFPAAVAWMPSAYTGSEVGVVNTATMVSGALFQKLVGVGLDHLWDGGLCNGVPYYASPCYQFPLSIILLNLGMGTLFALLMKRAPRVRR